MNLFPRFREHYFDKRFALDEAGCRRRAEWARELGAGKADIEAILSGQVSRGMTFGAAQVGDVARLVRRVLFQQGAQEVTLKIGRWPTGEANKIGITVIEVAQPDQPRTDPPTERNGQQKS
jgi:hypothetical protein